MWRIDLERSPRPPRPPRPHRPQPSLRQRPMRSRGVARITPKCCRASGPRCGGGCRGATSTAPACSTTASARERGKQPPAAPYGSWGGLLKSRPLPAPGSEPHWVGGPLPGAAHGRAGTRRGHGVGIPTAPPRLLGGVEDCCSAALEWRTAARRGWNGGLG
eukprot:SAG22_NODE_591_length_8819_cov_3.667737_2_plen_161_part_00